MPRLTEQQIQDKVFKNTLETCEYISGYENGQSTIKIRCKIHEYEFTTKWENVRRDNRPHYVCPYCQKEDNNKNKVEVECAYCHAKFLRSKSKSEKSKSNLQFCCREHKDLAQRLNSGKEFQDMRPSHYGVGKNYREKAFSYYPHVCAICNYNEDTDILQVHHIDENRQNNELDNLIILCPNCHAKLTFGKYKLIDRTKIVKI